jgi:very-short-patch-repair endonuclease
MPEIHNKSVLKQNRKNLRNSSTSAESVLWTYLKSNQLEGRKFRRQHSVCNYIVDFYCASELLAIELDGAHHFTLSGSNKDYTRDTDLAKLNIKVLRFENNVIFKNIDGVLDEIKKHFRKG